jgi:hypothetical protein
VTAGSGASGVDEGLGLPAGAYDGGSDAQAAGERVETLLAELRARAGPEAADTAEELVGCLVRLYGAGLASIMRLIGDDSKLKARLIADPLVDSLLLIHDLHPLDVGTRIRRALGRLGIGAELLSIDEEGVALIRLSNGHGHAGVQADVEQAVADAAPETTAVEIAPREAPLLQIARRPPGAA